MTWMQPSWPEIVRTEKALADEVEALEEAGYARVKAEMAAKRAKAYAMLAAKERGLPASILPSVIYSDEGLLEAEAAKGYAEVDEKVCQEKINELKHRLVTQRDEYAREWQQAGRSR